MLLRSRVTSFIGRETTQKLYEFFHILVMINLFSWERGVFQAEEILCLGNAPRKQHNLANQVTCKSQEDMEVQFGSSCQSNFRYKMGPHLKDRGKDVRFRSREY